jgi:tetratricopeptide (TPR) repeat protein
VRRMSNALSNRIPQEAGLNMERVPFRSVWFFGALSIVALHFLLVFIVPRFWPYSFLHRTWGFHFISYYLNPLIAAFYLIAILAALPPLNALLVNCVRRLILNVIRLNIYGKKNILFTVVSLASIFIFLFVRTQYALLGDGYLRAGNVERCDFLGDEAGVIYFMHFVFRILHHFFGANANGASAILVCSYVCGGIFVYLSLLIADEVGKSFFGKVLVCAGMLTLSLIQQFAGYVEVYAPPIVLLTLYMYLSILCLRGKIHIVFPILCLSAAILLHLLATMYLPSLAVVVLVTLGQRYPYFRKKSTLVLVTVVIAMLSIWPAVRIVLPRMYPLLPAADGRLTMFGIQRIWEFANSQVLACGTWVFPALMVIYALITRLLVLDSVFAYLAFAAFFPFAGMFGFETILGSADWDILSIPSIGILVFVSYGIINLRERTGNGIAYSYACSVLILFMALETFAWLGINATDASIKRFEDIVIDDPASYYRTHYPTLVLESVLGSNGFHGESFRLSRATFKNHPDDPRALGNYAFELVNRHRYAEADPILKILFDKYPYYTWPIHALVPLYLEKKRRPNLLFLLRRLFNVYEQVPSANNAYFTKEELAAYLSLYRELLMKEGKFDEAYVVCATMALRDTGDIKARYYCAVCLKQLGKYKLADSLCIYLTKKAPAFGPPYVLASSIYESERDFGKTARILRECSVHVADEQIRNQVRKSLARLMDSVKTR